MVVPNYAILIVIATLVFMAVTLSALTTYGIARVDLPTSQKIKFASRFSLYMLLWVTLALAISSSNILVPRIEQSFPLLGVLILGATILGGVLLFKSPTALAVLEEIPIGWLASAQLYRVVGILFLLFQADGLLSPYFAFSTGWGDIVVGVTAPVIGFLLWKDARRFWVAGLLWCVIGTGDLLTVLYKAVNSAPGPLQTTAFDLPTVIIGYFPISLVPLLVVPISLILHGVLVVRLVRKK